MRNLYCKLTGGHNYDFKKIEKHEDTITGQMDIFTRCKKCGHSKIIGIYNIKIPERQGEQA